METHVAVAEECDRLRDVRIFQEPLEAQARLDRHVGAFAEADVVLVRLFLEQQAALLEHFGGTFASVEAVEAIELGGIVVTGIGDLAVGREDVDDGQVVALADFVVALVVRGRDLEHAGAEAFLHRVVGDDRNFFVMQRTPHLAADEMRPLAAGFHGERDVGHDGLGARGGHHEIIGGGRREIGRGLFARGGNLIRGDTDFAFLQRHAMRGVGIRFGIVSGRDGKSGVVDQLVLHIIERALLLGRDHFLVGERGERAGAPVHHAQAAIDEALVVELHENFLHGAGVVGVEREAFARPVARCADLAELLRDDAAEFVLPFPDAGDEFIAAEIVARFLFRGADAFLHGGLRGEPGVVGAGEPEHFLAFHARLAGEDVLDGVV